MIDNFTLLFSVMSFCVQAKTGQLRINASSMTCTSSRLFPLASYRTASVVNGGQWFFTSNYLYWRLPWVTHEFAET